MFGRKHVDRDEASTRGTQDDANLGGYYARDPHDAGYGDEYAREDLIPPHGDPLVPRESERRTGPSSYRGVGPKNFRRSDDRVREEICERLSEADDVDATDVDVRVTNGVVLLTGRVDSAGALGVADHIAHSCGGVRQVENRINVGKTDREIHIGKAME